MKYASFFVSLALGSSLLLACGSSITDDGSTGNDSGAGGSVVGSGGAATGAGGSSLGSGGAAAATGGSGSVGTPGDLHGFYPTTVTATEVKGYYDSWVAAWVEDCGDGSARVKWDTPSQTVSEGIGYGMLLAAAWGDRTLFDKFSTYYSKNANSNGLMSWKVNGCGAPLETGAATDADLDAAMALLQADCQWADGGYGTKATAVIGAIRSKLMPTDGTHTFLCAGDAWGGDCCGNASYQAPAYYRAFGIHTGDTAFWNQAADDTYHYLSENDNATTGLVSDWMDPDTLKCDAKGWGNWHGWDASRVPWRVVTDFAWWGTAAAETYSQTMSDFVASKGGPASTCQGYALDGSTTCAAGSAVSTFAGAFASSAIASSQERSDSFFTQLKSVNHDGYFNEILRVLYFTLAVKQFSYCGG